VILVVIGAIIGSVICAFGGMFIGVMIGFIPAMVFERYDLTNSIRSIMTGIGAVVGILGGGVLGSYNADSKISSEIGIGIVIWIIFMVLAIWWAYKHYKNSYSKWNWSTNILSLLSAGLGISFGIISIVGFLNPYILFALTGTSLPALSMLFYPPLQRRKLIAKYRQSEESLIKP